MSPPRNGSLFANALLVAIGAAAGAGMTYLLVPHCRRQRQRFRPSRAGER
jgi:hypothetical protein